MKGGYKTGKIYEHGVYPELGQQVGWLPAFVRPSHNGWYQVQLHDGSTSVRLHEDGCWWYPTAQLGGPLQWQPNDAFKYWRPLAEPKVDGGAS